mmetsp:Transcript_27452/g.69227  ORF Transcript_27452/g.69227 Transcript_27452/m.69227 type:complete len:530 (+) Transcript_27452:83-1672(+)
MDFFRALGLGRDGCFEPSPFVDLSFYLHELVALDGDEKQVSLLVRSHGEDARRFVFDYPAQQCVFLQDIPRNAVLLFQIWEPDTKAIVAQTTIPVSDEICYMRWLRVFKHDALSSDRGPLREQMNTGISVLDNSIASIVSRGASPGTSIDGSSGLAAAASRHLYGRDGNPRPRGNGCEPVDGMNQAWTENSVLACFSMFPTDDAKAHFPLHQLENNGEFKNRAWAPLLDACEIQHTWLCATLHEETRLEKAAKLGGPRTSKDGTTKDTAASSALSGRGHSSSAATSSSSSVGDKTGSKESAKSGGAGGADGGGTVTSSTFSRQRRISAVAEEAEAAADGAMRDIEIRALRRQVEELQTKLSERELERDSIRDEFELTRSTNEGLVGGLRKRQVEEAQKRKEELHRLEQLVARKDATLKELLRKSNLKIDEGNATILRLKAERDKQTARSEALEKELREKEAEMKRLEEAEGESAGRLAEKNTELLKIVQSLYDTSDQQGCALNRESLDAFTRKWSVPTTPATVQKKEKF